MLNRNDPTGATVDLETSEKDMLLRLQGEVFPIRGQRCTLRNVILGFLESPSR
jgi:hypothetical protein